MYIILILILILIILLIIDTFCEKKENFVFINDTDNYILQVKELAKEIATLTNTINTNSISFISSSTEFIKTQTSTQQQNLTYFIQGMNYWIPEVAKNMNNIKNSINEIPLSPQVKQILLKSDIILNMLKEAERNGIYIFLKDYAPNYVTYTQEYNNADISLYATNINNAAKTLSKTLANLKDNILTIKQSIKQYVFTDNIYKKENIANAVKNGDYSQIENDVFNLNNESSYWQLTVVFKYIPNSRSTKQGIIGNMYNNYVNNIGWGLWVDNNIIKWSESNNTQTINTYEYAALNWGYTYTLVITFENNKYFSQLTNLEANTTNYLNFEKKSPLITDTGYVTIGGWFQDKPEERFLGDIISIQLIPTKAAAEKTVSQSLGVLSKPFYIVENPQGIKNGDYKNISNNTFGLNSNLTNWTITIMINSNNYSGSWQSIVGNMYNNSLWIGWGMWVNPNSVLHWRTATSTWNLYNLGNLINNTPYKIVINFDNNTYKFTLTNLNTNTNNSQTIQNQPKLEADTGFITLGGLWNKIIGEQFNGTINYLDFFTPLKI